MLSAYLDFAIEAAREAGKILMDHYGEMHELAWKERRHFKTIVDDESDKFINDAITERFPNHSILSEELDDWIRDSEWKWVVDPLDGTIPYTFGFTDKPNFKYGAD